jgi:hypothetical protein
VIPDRLYSFGKFAEIVFCWWGDACMLKGGGVDNNLFSTKATVNWEVGEAKIKTFRLFGSRHIKSFCSDCGSALPVLQAELGLLVVPAGSLDTEINIRPNAHVCYSSRANWDSDLASIQRLDGLPGLAFDPAPA